MVQAGDLLRQGPADGEAFEFGTEAGAVHVLRVVLERDRRRGFDVVNAAADVRHVFVEGVERRFDEVLLAGLVLFFAELCPVVVVRIGARNDEAPWAAFGTGAAGSKTNTCGW